MEESGTMAREEQAAAEGLGLVPPYAPTAERSIRFDDPGIGIEWPMAAGDLIVSPRDRAGVALATAEVFA